MCITLLEFYVQFSTMPFHFSYAPLWGSSPAEGQAIVLGIVTFGCAYVITSKIIGFRILILEVPSWVNEKKDDVSVNKAVWYSSLFGLLIKFIFGWFAACTIPNPKRNANILNGIVSDLKPFLTHAVMTTQVTGWLGLTTKISVYLFNISTIIPGIPVYSIMTRYNLLTSNITGPLAGNIVSVLLPWFVSMFFYHGAGFRFV